MPLILPGNVASATASTTYDVDNSCRFNPGDSAYLNKTNGTPTNSKKCTLSMWFKRCELSDSNNFLFGNWTGTTDYAYVRLQADDTIKYTSIISSSTDADLITTQVFRDCSAWYHIVLALDTEQGTAANRAKLYINGTQVTSFSTEDYPAEDATTQFTENLSSGGFQIGSDKDTGSRYYDGYMAEVVVIDGTQYAASDFGEFDSDSPTIWKPKDVSGLTFGDNGAYLDFEDSDNLGDDESGNTNDWTGNNLDATDQATDTPTNNFCTLNPLTKQGSYSLAHGNTYLECNDTDDWELGVGGTIGAKSGKYYWEVKQTTGSNPAHTDYNMFGFNKTDKIYDGNRLYSSGNGNFIQTRDDAVTGVVIYGQTGTYTSSVEINGSKVSIADDDIVSFALDLDNRKCWMGVDGVWVDDKDGNTNGASINTSYPLWGTGEITADTFYTPASIQYYDVQCYYNFGNPAFTITSGNADANGYGNFEYAVPSGYYALCTKNLAEYG